MSLPALLDGVSLPADVAAAIVDLRARKAAGVEAGKGARIAALDAFCTARMAWARAHLPGAAPAPDAGLARAAAAMFHASVFGHPSPARSERARGDVGTQARLTLRELCSIFVLT